MKPASQMAPQDVTLIQNRFFLEMSLPAFLLEVKEDSKGNAAVFFKMANRVALEMLHVGEDQVIESDLSRYFANSAVYLMVLQTIRDKQNRQMKLKWQIDEKTPRKYIDYKVFSMGENFVGMMCEDVTEQVEAEILASKDRAQRFHQSQLFALGQMCAGIAHEINNPLAVISGNVSIVGRVLEKNNVEATPYILYLEKINKMVERVTKIIKGLRNFARDGSHDPMEEVNLKALIKETLDLCKMRFEGYRVPLQVDLGEEDSIVRGRPVQISQVILNILNNAFDAVETLEEKWVSLKLKKQDKNIIVEISDSGKGIPKDAVEKIFQPFYTTKDPQKGMGLGLSISHGIIMEHEGELSVDCTQPHTTFAIRLPEID